MACIGLIPQDYFGNFYFAVSTSLRQCKVRVIYFGNKQKTDVTSTYSRPSQGGILSQSLKFLPPQKKRILLTFWQVV